jgi:hypothetical protein
MHRNPLFLLTLSLGLLAGCPQSSSGDRLQPDRLRSGPLSLDESLMTASLHGSEVQMQVVVGLEEGDFDALVELRLINLAADSDTTVAKQTIELKISQPGATIEGKLDGVRAEALGDLANYVIEAVITIGEHRVRARRSLFTAVPRLALHALGSRQLAVGADTLLRSFVRNASSGAMAPGVSVSFAISQAEGEAVELGQALSGDDGLAELRADLSNLNAGAAELLVSATGASGQALLRVGLELVDTRRLQLTTDKPRYQPGQTMHLRGLAIAAGDRSPAASEAVVIEIYDGAGNRVHRETKTTNAFGVFATDFRLADRLNEGNYLLKAILGETLAEEQVMVEYYRLPRMLASYQFEQTWLTPNGQLSGSVSLRYPFGQPVAEAQIEILGDALRAGEAQTVATFQGRSNAQGNLNFQLNIGAFDPAIVARGEAGFRITLRAVDSAGQSLTSQRSFSVAGGPSRVLIQPSAGRWLKKMTQPAIIIVTDPGAQPIEADLRLTFADGSMLETRSNAAGLARISIPPMEQSSNLRIDVLGVNSHTTTLPLGPLSDGLLITPNKRFLSAGQVIDIDIQSSQLGKVLIDALREGQVLSSTSLNLEAESGRAQIQLPEGLHGGVQLRALQRGDDGSVLTGLSLIHVDGGKTLNVQVSPERASYRPGENALLNIEVRDGNGEPQAAAVGITAVDASVFALSAAKPGVGEAYFDLGLRPGADASPAPSVAVSRALQTRDEDRAEAAFARLGGAGASIDQDSEIIDQGAARTHLIRRVTRELDGLVEQLKARWSRGEVDFGNYEMAMERMLIGRSDPFGKIYQHELGNWQASLISGGADEVFGTSDDLRVDVNLQSAVPENAARDRGDGDLMAQAEAGEVPAQQGAGGATDDNVAAPGEGGGSAAPRLRSWFPETLIAAPMIITDDNGHAEQALRVADSITTWKIAAQANSAAGHIGSGEGELVVFQPFFVDLDLPLSLTRGDEVHVPVIVYNYLEEPQTVALTLLPTEGITLVGGAEQSVSLAAGEVKRAVYILRAERVGAVNIEVLAVAGAESDAVRRTLRVTPDGEPEIQTTGGRLGAASANVDMELPEGVEGANELLVKIYPGLASSAVEGIESMLKMPGGCFEQTTSSSWPNIMVYQYLVATGTDDPELMQRAVEFIRAGYQRILTFESPTGGYNWWGNADPGNRILTAIALWQYADLEGIIETDPAVADRHRAWLIEQQAVDGSWPAGDALHAGNESLGEDVLRSTSFIAMGLHRDGKAPTAVNIALRYLRARIGETDDIYAVALAAKLFAEAAPDDALLTAMLNRLQEAGQQIADDQMKWAFTGNSWTGARGGGQPGEVEMTGLVVQSLLQAGQHSNAAQDGLTFLAATKDAFGNWYSTQATMNSLRALTQAALGATNQAQGRARVFLANELVGEIDIDESNADVHHTFDLSTSLVADGQAQIRLEFSGEGSLMYQVIGTRFEPWTTPPQQVGSLGLSVSYGRSQLRVGETLRVNAEVSSRMDEGAMDQVIVSIATAPGLVPMIDDLQALVSRGLVQRFERSDRLVTFYLMGLLPRESRMLSFAMQATRALDAQHPPSRAYSYYNPGDSASTGSTAVVVEP